MANFRLAAILILFSIHATGFAQSTSCAGSFTAKLGIEALERCETIAEHGDPNDQIALGDLFFYGRAGVTRNTAKGVTWYRRAAEKGSREAQYKLGLALMSAPQVNDEGREWVIRAALQGHEQAIRSVISLSQNDRGNADQQITSDEYLNALIKIAQQKNLNELDLVTSRICYMYRTGFGTFVDYKSAADWCAKSAESGGAKAEWELIKMHKQGVGIPQNHKKAEEMWQAFFVRQILPTADRDPKNVVNALSDAARNGFSSAAFQLSAVYEKGQYGVNPDREMSVRWRRFADKCKANEK